MDTKKQHRYNGCGNCGAANHNSKSCPEPVTSYGILHLSINGAVSKEIIDQLAFDMKEETKHIKGRGIRFTNDKNSALAEIFRDTIFVTMVRRKHSLGFMEFIRGRYKVENIDGIIDIFKLMVKKEIEFIGQAKTFDELWNDVWINDINNDYHSNEYYVAKEKYDKLLVADGDALNLKFYVDNVKPLYSTPEWGLPKGRRNNGESNIQCALREFEEETNMGRDEILVFDNIPPLVEEFIGSNKVDYRHVYFLAISYGDCNPEIDESNPIQYAEIGDIGAMDYEKAMELIRSYQTGRKKLINDAYSYVISCMLKISNNNDDK